jgi:hypothetical protein
MQRWCSRLTLGSPRFKLDRDTGYPTVLRDFPQYFQENAGVIRRLGHGLFKSFPINFSSTILLYDFM